MGRHTAMVTFLAVALVAIGLPLASQEGQDRPEAEFRGEIEVTEVLLDVVVTDNRGNVILGLQPEDFIVDDEGQRVEVTSATFYSNRRILDSGSAAERLGIEPDQVPIDRYFILFFHDQRAEDPELMNEELDALRWARKWVESELLPNDWVAVLSYDAKLKVHQDFSTNKDALLRALNGVAKGRDPGANWPSRQELDSTGGPSLRKNLPIGKELRRQTTRIYSGLEVTADAAGYILGRKNLLFFSMGFGELNDSGTYIPDERYYHKMAESLNDNNVAVYSISWLKNIADENAAQAVLQNSLSLLADDTGGRYYFNFANFREPLREVVDDNSGYYLLGYRSENPVGESGYRRVEVSTRNPDLQVRARQGYKYGT